MRYNNYPRKEESNVYVTGGSSFASLLTILFIALKLTEVINWGWFWILSPIIFTVALAVLFIIFTLIYIIILDLR